MKRSLLFRSLALGGVVALTASPAFAISPIAQAVITAVWNSLVPSMSALLAALTAAGATLWVARLIYRKFSGDTETSDFSEFDLEHEESNIDAARRRAIERSNGGLDDEMGGHLNDSFGEFELDMPEAAQMESAGLSDEMGGHLNDGFGEFELDWGGDHA